MNEGLSHRFNFEWPPASLAHGDERKGHPEKSLPPG
jgi:hypothetical protein